MFDGVLVVAWLASLFVGVLVFVVLGCWVWLCSGSFLSSSCSVSYPSMMTWAHRPHGVRTRGKNLIHVVRLHRGLEPMEKVEAVHTSIHALIPVREEILHL